MDQECQLDTLAWVSMACEHIRDFRFPILIWAEMHWLSMANVSRARLSFILKRFSSHLCIGRREFSLKNLTLEFSLCFFSYRSRKSGCSCIPSCRFFFFFFGHERVYLCVRPQFKAICDHKQYVCGAIFKQWLDYWCVTDHEIIVGIHKRRASFNDRLPLFNNIRSWRAVLKMMFAWFFWEE